MNGVFSHQVSCSVPFFGTLGTNGLKPDVIPFVLPNARYPAGMELLVTAASRRGQQAKEFENLAETFMAEDHVSHLQLRELENTQEGRGHIDRPDGTMPACLVTMAEVGVALGEWRVSRGQTRSVSRGWGSSVS